MIPTQWLETSVRLQTSLGYECYVLQYILGGYTTFARLMGIMN